MATLDTPHDFQFRTILRLAWSPDGSRIAAFGPRPDRNYAVAMWDARSGRSLMSIPHSGTVGVQLRFTADGSTLAVPAGSTARLMPNRLFADIGNGALLIDARAGNVSGLVPSLEARNLAVSPTAGYAAATSSNGTGLLEQRVTIYETPSIRDWRVRSNFVVPAIDISGLAFAPDGRPILAVASSFRDTSPSVRRPLIVTVRDLDGTVIWSVQAVLGQPASQSFTWGGLGAGQLFIGLSGTGGAAGPVSERVIALDGRTGARLWAAAWESAATVNGLAVNGSGTLVVAANGGQQGTRVLRVQDGATLASLPGLVRPSGVAWHPDGTRFAVNDADRVRIFAID